MKRFQLFVFITLLLALLASACNSFPSGPLTLTDGLGRQVTLKSPARSIVSLAPSNTEILFAVGAGPYVHGRDQFSDYPVDVKGLPSVGGANGAYDMEVIAALRPDLVLAASINTPEQVKALENLGLTVYYLPNPTDLTTLYDNIATVGKLTGFDQNAADLNTKLKARVQKVQDTLANTKDQPTVFYELDGTDPSKPWTAGSKTFLSMLIKLAGGKNVGDSLSSDYAQYSLEQLLVDNPTYILLGDAAYGATPALVAQRNGWSALQAVKDSKVVPFDDNLVSRPGPRLVDGLEALAKALHPDLFK